MGAITVKRTGSVDYGRYIKMLIAGAPGSGKTLISSTALNPFYASAEGGLMSIADKNIPYMDIGSSDELFALKLMLDQDRDVREKTFGFPIDTIVIDTIDEVQRILAKERMAETKKDSLTLQDFGWLKDQMTAIIRGFRNLDMNVIYLVHLKDTSDAETGKTFVKPGLTGAIADEIPAYVDMAFLLKTGIRTEVVDNAPKKVMYRVLQTMPDNMHDWIKDRSGKLSAEVPVNFKDDFQRITDLVYAHLGDLPDTAPVELGAPDHPFIEAVADEQERVAPQRPVEVPVAEKPEPEPVKKAAKPSSPTPAKKDTAAAPGLEEAKETAKPAEKPAEDMPNCFQCGEQVENADIRDLSRIRFREFYCKKCFAEKKKSA